MHNQSFTMIQNAAAQLVFSEHKRADVTPLIYHPNLSKTENFVL